jgi:hypothetical protein
MSCTQTGLPLELDALLELDDELLLELLALELLDEVFVPPIPPVPPPVPPPEPPSPPMLFAPVDPSKRPSMVGVHAPF